MLKYLYSCLLFLLLLGQFANATKSQGLNFYLFDLFAAIFAFVGLVYFLGVLKSLKIPRFFVFYLLFLFLAFLSLVLVSGSHTTDELLISAFYIVRFSAYLFTGIVVYNMLETNLISLNYVIRSLMLSGFVLSILGFIQLAVLPDFTVLDTSLGWDPHKNRLASTFFDPNFVGGYLSSIVALCLGLIFSPKLREDKIFLENRFLFGCLLVSVVAVFLTFSRSSWAMLSVIIFTFGIFKSRTLLFTALLLGFLTYFAVPRVQTRVAGITDPADSAHFRLISWKNTFKVIEDNYATGVGFNTFRYAQKEYGFFDIGSFGGNAGAGSDSSFLFVLATTGILGLFVYIAAYIFPLSSIITNNPFKYSFTAFSLGMFVQSQFINALFYPQLLFLLFMLIALLSVYSCGDN